MHKRSAASLRPLTGAKLGQVVTNSRAKRRLTIEQLAESSGLPIGYITLVEQGRVHTLDLDTILPLSFALRVSVDNLTHRKT